MSAVEALQSTSRVVMLKVFLSSDHVTAATGKTVAVTISKAGAAFANPSAGATNATEVASGWYKVTLSTTDYDTLGDLVVHGSASSCDDTERLFSVVKATNRGMSGIPDAAANANGGLPILSVSGTTLGYTVTTVTTNSDMRGTDSAALAATALTNATWTDVRAAKLDNLDRAISAIVTTVMTESYNADGSPPTPAQALMLILQRLTEFAIVGTSITVKKLDGSTQAAVLTLDQPPPNATSSTRTA